MKQKHILTVLLGGAVLALTACNGGSTSGSGTGDKLIDIPADSGANQEVATTNLAGGATGANFDFSGFAFAEKQKILGKLEKYALDNYLGGVPVFDNGAAVLYSKRVQLPTANYTYIPNYGFGVSEGSIDSDQKPGKSDTYAENPTYLHETMGTSMPSTFNAMNATGNLESDCYDLLQATYYGQGIKADGTGFEWTNVLASALPEAVKKNDDGSYTAETSAAPDTDQFTTWRVKFKTGLKYSTESTKYAAYNGRDIVLDDYITPFKATLDNTWKRSTELQDAQTGFAGAKEYYNKVVAKTATDADWDGVQIKKDTANNALVFTLNAKCTQFYAMYYLNESLYAPIPASFLAAVTPEKYGQSAKDTGKDSVLSTGAYTISNIGDKTLTFKANSNYVDKARIHYDGIYQQVYSSPDVAFQDFIAGKLDYIGIPSSQRKNYTAAEGANTTQSWRRLVSDGSVAWRVQTMGATAANWVKFFGPEGSISTHTVAETNARIKELTGTKHIMTTTEFQNGLYLCMDRASLADLRGANPVGAYLSNAYEIDPVNHISFRSTPEGQNVTSDRFPGDPTKSDYNPGYNLSAATTAFKTAIEAEIAAGRIVKGTRDNPTTIKFSWWWLDASNPTSFGNAIEECVITAFNAAVEGVAIGFDNVTPANYLDTYDAMEYGDSDFGFGGISGGTFDPCGLMGVFSSDNHEGFTLSWNDCDTSLPSEDVSYNSLNWSYDALTAAVQRKAFVKNGSEATDPNAAA